MNLRIAIVAKGKVVNAQNIIDLENLSFRLREFKLNLREVDELGEMSG